jgi:hypothetical protein
LNRKLMVLNVALAGAIVYGGVELRGQWLAEKAREARLPRGQVAPAPPPPFTKLPEVAPVMASGYAEVAQKFLLDPSRNPDVPVEVVPPPPPPPPPPPMPPLPVFHGMMNIGNGPEVIMSVNPLIGHQRVQAGGAIGDFTLVSFNSEQIELEWNGKRIVKSLAELSGHKAGPQAAQESAPEVAAAPARVAPVPAELGPGMENAVGERACQEGDTLPAGAEREGVVKVVGRNSLLGTPYCIWRPKR